MVNTTAFKFLFINATKEKRKILRKIQKARKHLGYQPKSAESQDMCDKKKMITVEIIGCFARGRRPIQMRIKCRFFSDEKKGA
jgi:hypothetical protein